LRQFAPAVTSECSESSKKWQATEWSTHEAGSAVRTSGNSVEADMAELSG
jgi:hypothetical protein